jgi:glycerol uptake facilitator-like aquaporin
MLLHLMISTRLLNSNSYPGVASTASFVLNTAGKNEGFGSILQIGFAFALGIAFAIITCASTSGGHFSPSITICLTIWQGFPLKKVPYYIFAQILGSFLAACVVMGQYWQQIHFLTTVMKDTNVPGIVGAKGPAAIFVSFPGDAQTNLGFLFMIEFFVDSYIVSFFYNYLKIFTNKYKGIIIWSCLDPANPFITPAVAPFIIGLGYATMIWGFADITISTNMAKDLGCRLAAWIFFGGEVFSYKDYSWISILVNIPATIFSTCFYELVLRDSLQKIQAGHAHHEDGEEGLLRHMTKTGQMPHPNSPISYQTDYAKEH